MMYVILLYSDTSLCMISSIDPFHADILISCHANSHLLKLELIALEVNSASHFSLLHNQDRK